MLIYSLQLFPKYNLRVKAVDSCASSSNRGLLTDMENDCYIWGKTLSFLSLPCGTVMWIPSQPGCSWLLHHPFHIFAAWNMLTYLCMVSFSESNTMYHLFQSTAPTDWSRSWKAFTPHHCWLALFCLLAAFLLSYSSLVIYSTFLPPHRIFFPSTPLKRSGLV